MKYKLSLLPLLLAGMLASCNSDEEIIRTNPDYVEAGYGALTVTLTNPGGARTKAGEEVNVSTAEEKKIGSVAFFVQTDAEEVDGSTKAGKFGSYFSTEELLSANGLQEELAEVAAGQYTAKIRHQSDGWGKPRVIVIANYAENGLTETLKGIQNWNDLASIQSIALTANPVTPLLMYATANIDAWESGLGNTNGGGSASTSFELERLVSRIDIHNNAYNADDQNSGFVLTSARLIRPKTRSYLIPGNAGIASIEVAAQPFPASGTLAVVDGVQILDTLYTYENANDVEATATAVQIDGTFRGGNISRVIPFKKADGVGTTGDPIALARNTRYVININPAADSTDIAWNITVKDWAESDTIKVKPVFPVPVLSNVVTGSLAGGMSWDGETKTISTDGTATGTLTFSTFGTTASTYEVAYGYDTDGSSIEGDLAATPIVVADKPIITYAAQIETPFTINVPVMSETEAVPLDIYVIIKNGGNEAVRDTITIERRPVYNGLAGIKPVLMKGTDNKERFWAPVNVGATELPTSITSSSVVQSTCGYYFQWGRIYGFPVTGDVATTSTLVNDTTGFESNETWKDKFITSSSSPYDWANPQINDLWNSGTADRPVKTAYDPCPKGWRVPTLAEWNTLGTGSSNTDGKTFASGILTIPGVDGNLLLPAAGNRSYNNGSLNYQGSYAFYWSSSVSGTSVNRVDFSSATLNTNTCFRMDGASVRCVQE